VSSKETRNNLGLCLVNGQQPGLNSWARAQNHLSNLSMCTDKNPCTTLQNLCNKENVQEVSYLFVTEGCLEINNHPLENLFLAMNILLGTYIYF